MQKLSQYSKFIVGLIGAVATWATATFPDNVDVQTWVSLVVALITAAGVYAVKNTPTTEVSTK